MFFKDVKQNYPIFILDTQELTVTNGKVVSVSFPRMDNKMPGFTPGQSSQMVVDVVIEANGKSATYTIPENLSVSYAGNLVLSTDNEGIVRELEAMKSTAEQVLASVDRQQNIVKKATDLLADLNPTYRAKRETEERFGKIEGSIEEIHGAMSEMKTMMANFLKEFKS